MTLSRGRRDHPNGGGRRVTRTAGSHDALVVSWIRKKGRAVPTEPERNQTPAKWFFAEHAAGRPASFLRGRGGHREGANSRGWTLDDPVADFEVALRTFEPGWETFFRLLRLSSDRLG